MNRGMKFTEVTSFQNKIFIYLFHSTLGSFMEPMQRAVRLHKIKSKSTFCIQNMKQKFPL